jgi:hypothetical protein
MKKKISRPFSLYYRFHRFNFLGIRIAFFLTRASSRLFYQVRNTAILIDSLLSCLLYLSIVATVWSVFTAQRHNSATMLVLLTSAVLFLWLLRQERKERRHQAFTPFSIYDINIGSAKTLRGNVSIGHLFVDDRTGKWTKKKIARVMRREEQALSWIREQAERYRVDVTIGNKLFSDVEIPFLKPIPDHVNRYKHLDEFHELIGSTLRNPKLSQFKKATDEGDNVCLFVHVLTRTRSFAVPDFVGKKPEKSNLEYSVVAYGERPSTYAHELLHLFGANDYYSEYSQTMQRLKSRLLARSIMFYGGYLPLENLVIDELTAQNIGWL